MAARDFINTDTSKMSEPEFRITIIRILAGVENRLESLFAEIKEVKASQDEIKNSNWAAFSNGCHGCKDGWDKAVIQWYRGQTYGE